MSLFIICAFVIIFCAVLLLMHCAFDEGIPGHLALLGFIGAESIAVWEWLHTGYSYDTLPFTEVLQYSLTLWLLQHTFRFLMWWYFGKYSWRTREQIVSARSQTQETVDGKR